MKRSPEQLSFETMPIPPPRGSAERITIDPAAQALEIARSRLFVTAAAFAALFLIVVLRLGHVTLLGVGGEPALARPAGDVLVPVERADIVDRNGVLLATNLETASLYAEPHRVLDPAEAAARLVRVLPDLDRDDLVGKLRSGRRFVWLKRGLTPTQQYEVNRLGLPGLAFQREQRRVYPLGALAAHAVGFTDVDNYGLAGIEKARNDRLAFSQANGDGALALALDIGAQHIVKDELSAAIETFRAKAAVGLVLDARSGEVMALVSLPDFDPNRVGESSAEARFNRASLGVYELGSVFKTFTVAAALDRGTVDLADGFDATKPIRAARFMIRDDHPQKRWLSVPEIFVYSSNIGAAKMALELGAEAQRAFLDNLGLLRRASFELGEVGLPLYPERWREISTMTIAFGHGIAVSPLQLTAAVATIVNGGMTVRPSMIKGGGGERPRRVIARGTSAVMRKLLRLVVEQGTGKNAAAPGYLVGGKTGTAEKVGDGGYRRDALLSSFVGAFPMTAPRYVVFALLDEPVGTKSTYGFATAGWTAAPVVGRIIMRLAPLFGLPPVDEAAPEITEAMALDVKGGKFKLASF